MAKPINRSESDQKTLILDVIMLLRADTIGAIKMVEERDARIAELEKELEIVRKSRDSAPVAVNKLSEIYRDAIQKERKIWLERCGQLPVEGEHPVNISVYQVQDLVNAMLFRLEEVVL